MPSPSIVRAILSIFIATVLFVCMNAAVKVLSPHLPTVELIWARSLGHLLFVIAIFAPGHGGWRLFVTRRPGVQFIRSIMLLTSTSFFFTALGHVPLADATAVSFTSPFIVAALSAPLLGERVALGHWIAIAVGFAGALIVIRPTGEGTNPALALVLGSAFCYAVYQILTRRVAGLDRPETSVTYSALVGTLVLSVAVPFWWRTPESALHWALIGALGLLGGLGHYFVARAFQWGPAALISPFHYIQLVWAAVIGYLVFGHLPTAWTWIGAAIIVAGGVAIAWQETRGRSRII